MSNIPESHQRAAALETAEIRVAFNLDSFLVNFVVNFWIEWIGKITTIAHNGTWLVYASNMGSCWISKCSTTSSMASDDKVTISKSVNFEKKI